MNRREIVTAVALVAFASPASPASPASADRPPLTHTTPLTPTGELVPAGHGERTQSVAAFHHDLAVGLADGLELRLQSPLLPVPVIGGALGLRASALPPASRLRVVLGAGAAAEWARGGDVWLDGAVTVAWRGERWGAHATVRGLDHRAPREEANDSLVLATAGVTVRAGRALLHLDGGDLAWLHPSVCEDEHAREVPCLARDAVHAVVGGAWFAARDLEIGVAAMIGWRGGTVVPVLPLLSFRWTRDL